MRKILFAIVLFWSFVSIGQIQAEKTGGQLFEGYSSAVLNGLSTKPNGLLVRNSTVNTLWYWNGTEFKDLLAGGSSYVFSTGLTNTSGTITVNNATIAPLWTNVSGRPTVINNLTSTSTTDPLSAAQGKVLQDGTVKLTGDQTVGGTKTFTDEILADDYIQMKPISGANKLTDYSNISFNSSNNLRVVGGGLSNRYVFDASAVTTERTYTLQNASGTVAFLSDIAGGITDNQTLSEVLAEGNVMDANILLDSDITRSIGNVTNALSSIYNRSYIFKPQTSDPTYTVNLGQTFYRSDLKKISYWDGTKINRMATEDYVDELNGSYFIKKNIRIATTANITLSGLQVIDGNTTAEGERVLVKDQTDAAENGIYIASSGSWSRSPEANNDAKLAKTYIYVTSGGTMFNKFFQTDFNSSDDIGVDDVIFTETPFVLGGSGSMSDAEVLAALLGNANTNILTDAEKADLPYISDLVDYAQAQIDAKAPLSGAYFVDPIHVEDATANDHAPSKGQVDGLIAAAIADKLPVNAESEIDITSISAGSRAARDAATGLVSTDIWLLTGEPPIAIEATATFDLSEKKVYNDQTADAGTITVSGLESAVELYIYIDRATAPTLAGATWDPMDGTLAFEANVPMILYGVVHPNKTTINYCYIKL